MAAVRMGLVGQITTHLEDVLIPGALLLLCIIYLHEIFGKDLVSIYALFHTWDFRNADVCKCFLFIILATSSTSTILLLAVAITRYRKVCVPLGWQIRSGPSKIVSIVIALLSCLSSIPYTIVHGIQNIPTDRPDITGRKCGVDQEYVNTTWPLVISGVTLTIFLSCCIPLTVMYSRVGIVAWRHSNGLEQTAGRQAQRVGLETIGRKVANRTTLMLVTISIVYIVTNLTSLILVFVRSLSPQQVLKLSAGADSMYRLFLQLTIINSAANPFIYCMCDRNFKNESIALLKRLWARSPQRPCK